MAAIVSILPRIAQRARGATTDMGEGEQARSDLTPGKALSITGEICSLHQAASDAFFLVRDRSATFHGVRRLTHGKKGKRIIYFPSAINDGNIPCEGFPEQAHCLMLERQSNIAAYRSQPLTMMLPSGERYTPDKATLGHDGAINLYEVKSRPVLASPAIQKKLLAAKELALSSGMGFHLVPHDELPDDRRAANLCSYYDAKFRQSTLLRLLGQLDSVVPLGGTIRFGRLSLAWRSQGHNERALRHAVFLGILEWDIDSRLRHDSELLRVR